MNAPTNKYSSLIHSVWKEINKNPEIIDALDETANESYSVAENLADSRATGNLVPVSPRIVDNDPNLALYSTNLKNFDAFFEPKLNVYLFPTTLAFDTSLNKYCIRFEIPGSSNKIVFFGAEELSNGVENLKFGVDFVIVPDSNLIIFNEMDQNQINSFLQAAKDVPQWAAKLAWFGNAQLAYRENNFFKKAVFGQRAESIFNDKINDIINETLSSLVGFPDTHSIMQMLADIFGVKVAGLSNVKGKNNVVTEIVQEVIVNPDGTKTVITNKTSYVSDPEFDPAFSVNTVIDKPMFLPGYIAFYDNNSAFLPPQLDSIPFKSTQLLTSNNQYQINLPNSEVKVVVHGMDNGKLKISFEVGGFSADITDFFDRLHALGVSSGYALANLLDDRINPVGEPTNETHVKQTINPAKLFIEKLWSPHTVAVIIEFDKIKNKNSLAFLDTLVDLIPPEKQIFIKINKNDSDQASDQNTTESHETFTV